MLISLQKLSDCAYNCSYIDSEESIMSPVPVYQVEFLPSERRLNDRRVAPQGSALPDGVLYDRRVTQSRRADDRKASHLKTV
jgi:hypothetical protein